MPSIRRRHAALARLARAALAEDRAGKDRTSRSVLPTAVPAEATVVAQAPGIVAGLEAAAAVFRARRLKVRPRGQDGRAVRPGTVVLSVRGDARGILAAERSALNLLMHASGVATATARAVRAARGARRPLAVRATRKTLPGLRDLEKAAVVAGGGEPHRRDLGDALLVKSTHVDLVGMVPALRRARAAARDGEPVQVEVRSVAEALGAARAGAESLLIDNAGPAGARRIVRALERAGLRHRLRLELSGGITIAKLPAYRAVGADAVSLGAITHSAAALPFHLRLRRLRLSRRGS